MPLELNPRIQHTLNKKLQQKQEEKYWHRIKNVKPKVDISTPTQGGIAYAENVRQMINKQRRSEIERQNRLLADRIENVFRGQGRLDNWMPTYLSKKTTSTIKEPKRVVEEAIKVYHDNQNILRRLQKTGSYYERNKQLEDFEQRERKLEDISRFRHGWRQKFIGEKSSDQNPKTCRFPPINNTKQ